MNRYSTLKRKKPKRVQVTCRCGVYLFPHRLGGGCCRGRAWAESYREVDGSSCGTCNCDRQDGSCDVVEGLEDITYCQGKEDYERYQPKITLPISIERRLIDLYHSYGRYGEDE
ncbi:MAG: hypothetical protein KBD21_02020 [Candidatus Pacebacteria bacterium]|nr:hypothetical protein [Candidatus Paceibacterota bacterium]